VEWHDRSVSEPAVGRGPAPDRLAALLSGLTPAAQEVTAWGPLPLRITAYLADRRLPEDLITSVRCLVAVDRRIVVTRSADDVNIWPGGRREPGESLAQTVIREVHEETGCRLDPRSLRVLGFLHLEHLAPPPPDYPYPHPDFLQLVFAGRADTPPDADWRDVDGYVQAAWVADPAAARSLPIAAVSVPFLDAFEALERTG
jgi:8-oxo-dGTP pyrophosphatase MutT (NUDIX family)